MHTRAWSPCFACLALPDGLLLPLDSHAAGPPKAVAPGEALPAGARLRLGTSRFRIYTSGTHPLPSFDLSPDGKMLATRTGPWVRLLDPVTGQEMRTFRAGRTAEMEFSGAGATFTRDGRSLVTGNGIGRYLFWDVASGKVVRTFEVPRERRAPPPRRPRVGADPVRGWLGGGPPRGGGSPGRGRAPA